MLVSNGVVTKGAITRWTGSPSTWPGWGGWNVSDLKNRWYSYDQIYREVGWVRTVVDKRAWALARLPLKVYRRKSDDEREPAGDHPYAQLLRRPNERQSAHYFWLSQATTYDIYGECFAGKQRDKGGRPVQLIPLHPANMFPEDEKPGGEIVWRFENGRVRILNIPDSDLFHPKTFNPNSNTRGLSKLESLRSSIENDDAARKATSAFWRNGARPMFYLAHPGNLSAPAQERLTANWSSVHGGVDNWAKVAVLEEGMKPEPVHVTAHDAQYIDTRKLERDETISGYDVPPPAVHVLDRATFSNVVEQFKSLYRDTIANLTEMFESELETQVRGSRQRPTKDPDFGDEVYAEFSMDAVLRADFEQRTASYQQAINSAWMTPAEVRALENLPFIEGSDRLLVNSTIVLLEEAVKPKPEPGMLPTLPAPANGDARTVVSPRN